MGNMSVGGYLGHGDHEMIVFYCQSKEGGQ